MWVEMTIQQIMRFFTNAHKPMILALARPDPKKNLTTLLRAFGESRALRELANLVCFSFAPHLLVYTKDIKLHVKVL